MGHQDVLIAGSLGPFPDPVGQTPGAWTGIFRDEFTGSSVTILDANQSTGGTVRLSPGGPVWKAWYSTTATPHTNNPGTELEYYDFGALSLDGVSTLSLTATHDNVHSGDGLPYTSGMVQTNPSLNFQYGYIECRIKAPGDFGAWPAFWMMPASYTFPPEIDIFEDIDTHGAGYSMSNWGAGASVFNQSVSVDVTQWRVYGLKWSSGHLTWYLDGVQKANETVGSSVPAEPMYAVVNLAVRSADVSSYSMLVDYLRVWQ